MKKIFIPFLMITLLVVGYLFFQTPIRNNFSKLNPKMQIRIGWQTPWATQGQLVQALKHLDILGKNGFQAEFKGFTSGAPLNEAALAGAVDVIFTADQPAATLLAKNPNWTIIGRLMYNRVSLYVPPKSPIKTIQDLKGKTVAMPFGAAAQRMALKEETNAGLVPDKDVKNINLDILEQGELVRSSDSATWKTIDALAGFDPSPAIFEEKGLVRNIAVGKVVSVIVMSNDYIKKNPKAPAAFMKSMYDAYAYYRGNVITVDAWFTQESRLDITPNALRVASSLEPNLDTNNAIRLSLNDEDLKILQEAADFIYDRQLIKTKVIMSEHIDSSYVKNLPVK